MDDFSKRIPKITADHKGNVARIYVPRDLSNQLPWEDKTDLICEVGEDGYLIIHQDEKIFRGRFLRAPYYTLITFPLERAGDHRRTKMRVAGDSLGVALACGVLGVASGERGSVVSSRSLIMPT